MVAQMNPVLMLCHNALDMTKRAVCSVLYQDIPTRLLVIDNASDDGTWEWLQQQPEVESVAFRPQLGVSKGWNWGLRQWFEFGGRSAEHVLVLNNDVELPKWFYRTLLSRLSPTVGFVTGVSVDNRPYCQSAREPKTGGEAPAMAPCPDFSAFCISRRVWQAVGPFDERMVFYAGDNDYHVRAARAGLPLMNCGAPFYHERSSTLRQASAEERAQIEAQANADRAVFKGLYGCNPWDPEYSALITT